MCVAGKTGMLLSDGVSHPIEQQGWPAFLLMLDDRTRKLTPLRPLEWAGMRAQTVSRVAFQDLAQDLDAELQLCTAVSTAAEPR